GGSWYVVPPLFVLVFFFFQAEDGIRDRNVTGVQTCALPIYRRPGGYRRQRRGRGRRSPRPRASVREARQAPLVPLSLPGISRSQIGRASCREKVAISEEADCRKRT